MSNMTNKWPLGNTRLVTDLQTATKKFGYQRDIYRNSSLPFTGNLEAGIHLLPQKKKKKKKEKKKKKNYNNKNRYILYPNEMPQNASNQNAQNAE